MNGQLRRSEQLSGRAGVGLCPTWAAPSPSPAHLPGESRARTLPPQPAAGWAPLREGGRGCPRGPPTSLECSATSIPWAPRLCPSRSRPAQGALDSPHRARGGGDRRWGLPGGGGDRDFALCLSLQSHQPKPDPIGEPGSRQGAGSPSGVL